MWSGRPKLASVCLRCQLRINPRLLSQAESCTYSHQRNARAQSTAAAIVEEPGEDEREHQNQPTPGKTQKKRLRRVWKPPHVAELGVSSLGKPAEVLVLKDRDRHVPANGDDESERFKASEPRILETLQAENLPLSSENVRQSLDQISAPYRNQSKALSANERAELKKNIVDGFTLQQLQSFCIACDRNDPVNAIAMQVGQSKAEIQAEVRPGPGKKSKREKFLATMAIKRGKAGLVEYILKHIWSIQRPENEQAEERIAIPTMKVQYVLSHMQSSLRDYGLLFNVAIDTSKDGRSIDIKGGLKRVSAAQEAIDLFLKDVEVSRIRSVRTGRALRHIVTSAFVSHLTKTYKVVIAWASELDKDVLPREDWLNICYHKNQGLQDARSAERDILLAERRLLPNKETTHREQRISMWVPGPGVPPNFVPHQAPKQSNSLTRMNAWARWVLPQQPIQLLHPGPNDAVAKSPMVKMQEFFRRINKQNEILHKYLKGKNDEFFPEMKLKLRSDVRKFINSGRIKEEIFVHFGRIAFSKSDMTLSHDFHLKATINNAKFFRGKGPASTVMLPDLPGLPNYLTSVVPFDDAGSKSHTGTYRLRYVPRPSGLPPGFEAPLVEIDVRKPGEPGSIARNHVQSAWAIVDEQSHQLLTPAFAVDLGFVRRLKSQLFSLQGPKHDPESHIRSSKKFVNQFEKWDGERFPQFLNMIMPQHTLKGRPPTIQPADDEGETHSRQLCGSIDDGVGDSINELLSVSAEPGPAPVQNTTQLQKVDYMLESWDLIASKSYKTHNLCLEHLSIDGETAEESRESLRLAPQSLLQSEIKQTVIPILLESAFKVAAQMSDSGLFERPKGTSHLVPGEQKKRSSNTQEKADENASPSADHLGPL